MIIVSIALVVLAVATLVVVSACSALADRLLSLEKLVAVLTQASVYVLEKERERETNEAAGVEEKSVG